MEIHLVDVWPPRLVCERAEDRQVNEIRANNLDGELRRVHGASDFAQGLGEMPDLAHTVLVFPGVRRHEPPVEVGLVYQVDPADAGVTTSLDQLAQQDH